MEPRLDPYQHAVAVAIATAAAAEAEAEAALVAKQAAAATVRFSASKHTVVGIDDAAATKIQAVFRSYLVSEPVVCVSWPVLRHAHACIHLASLSPLLCL